MTSFQEFLTESSTLQGKAFFHNFAHISAMKKLIGSSGTNVKFDKVLKSLLNFVSCSNYDYYTAYGTCRCGHSGCRGTEWLIIMSLTDVDGRPRNATLRSVCWVLTADSSRTLWRHSTSLRRPDTRNYSCDGCFAWQIIDRRDCGSAKSHDTRALFRCLIAHRNSASRWVFQRQINSHALMPSNPGVVSF